MDKYRLFSEKSRGDNICLKNWQFMIILPAILLIIAVFLEYSGFDVWWISHFYDSEQHIWPYKHHWLCDKVIHSGGQLFDRLFVLLWIFSFIMANYRKSLSCYRKPLLYFLCASAAGPIFVGIFKSCTHIFTPWDIVLFNGKYPYIKLFDSVPPGLPVGHAFPAGHASGGYCFLSLFFFLHRIRPSYKFYGLGAGLLLGILFGTGQQIRGAHFPSHDIFTLVICWYSSLLLYFLFYRKKPVVI